MTLTAIYSRISHDPEGRQLGVERQEQDCRRNALTEAFAEGEIDRAQLRAGSERLRGRLLDMSAALAGMAVTPAVAQLVSSSDVQTAWAALDLPRRRSIIHALLTVQLNSSGRGARQFDPATVPMSLK